MDTFAAHLFFSTRRGGQLEFSVAVPNVLGGSIPLGIVAQAMAKAIATNGGVLTFHRPTYESSLIDYSADLLNAARSGRLVVCNSRGAIGSFHEISTSPESINECVPIDGGGDFREMFILHTTVLALNDWRKQTGDSFSVTDLPVEFIDYDLTDHNGNVLVPGYYRGFVGLTEVPDQDGVSAKPKRSSSNWILIVQAEATLRWKELKKSANPTKHNIKDDLAKWCRDTDVRSSSGIHPNGDYIYRHVLQKWTPPSD